MVSDEEEADHWKNVMRTFLHYEEFVAFDLSRRQEHINKLPAAYSDRLPNTTFEKFGALQHAARSNQDVFEDIVHFQLSNGARDHSVAQLSRDGQRIPLNQQHRNIAVLHSMYREWSAEGAEERNGTFKLLVDELKLRLPVTDANAFKQKVLVPGCGLGRLPLEIAAAGYACQGNEYSAFMAIAGNFMLNAGTPPGEYHIYPWISNVCNIAAVQDSLQGVAVPDVAAGDLLDSFRVPEPPAGEEGVARAQTCPPSPHEPMVPARWRARQAAQSQQAPAIPEFPRFSMATGDFVEVYTNLKDAQFLSQQGRPCVDPATGIVFSDSSLAVDSGARQWDAVVTCFFLDTAPVVLEYIEVIERILKPGGVWINLGPLLYHWAAAPDSDVGAGVGEAGSGSGSGTGAGAGEDARYAQSVELSYEEVRHVVEGYGFEFLQQERWQDCTYSRCESAMMWTTYRTVMFTVRKPVTLCKDCSV